MATQLVGVTHTRQAVGSAVMGISIVVALILSKMVRTYFGGLFTDAQLGAVVAFLFSFLTYLAVFGIVGALWYFLVGSDVQDADEETVASWEIKLAQPPTTAHLTQITPVP